MSVQMTRMQAVELCTAIGFKTASKWNKDRMLRKLMQLPDMVEDDGLEIPEDVDGHDRLQQLLDDIHKSDGNITLTRNVEEVDASVADAKVDDVKEEPKKKMRAPSKASKSAKNAKVEDDVKEEESKKKSSEVESKKPKNVGKRSIRNRRYCAGIVLREHGLEEGITEEMIQEVDAMYGDSNMVASKSQLTDAWHAINGFVNG